MPTEGSGLHSGYRLQGPAVRGVQDIRVPDALTPYSPAPLCSNILKTLLLYFVIFSFKQYLKVFTSSGSKCVAVVNYCAVVTQQSVCLLFGSSSRVCFVGSRPLHVSDPCRHEHSGPVHMSAECYCSLHVLKKPASSMFPIHRNIQLFRPGPAIVLV